MARIYPIFLALLLLAPNAFCAKLPGTDLEEKMFPLKYELVSEPVLSKDELESEIHHLNKFIGSYPPRFRSESERQKVYEQWKYFLGQMESHSANEPKNPRSLYLLAELYRQGHNMDVENSAEKAISNLDQCDQLYPSYIPCHFSASYLYLSIGPKHLDKAEYSLDFLRNYFSENPNPEVEAGYVFLYLYRQDVRNAKLQIDQFISTFPTSPRTEMFKAIKSSLGDSIEWQEHNDKPAKIEK